MPDLITIVGAAAAFPANGLIAGILGAGVGALVVVVIAEGASTAPSKPRMIPIWMWLAFWIPLGLILIMTDMPGWMRTLLFLIPMALTFGLFNRRAA